MVRWEGASSKGGGALKKGVDILHLFSHNFFVNYFWIIENGAKKKTEKLASFACAGLSTELIL